MSIRGVNSLWINVLVLFSCLAPFSNGYYYEEKRKPIYLNGLVGSFVVFNCKIQFPIDVPVPYILNWYKDVSEDALARLIV